MNICKMGFLAFLLTVAFSASADQCSDDELSCGDVCCDSETQFCNTATETCECSDSMQIMCGSECCDVDDCIEGVCLTNYTSEGCPAGYHRATTAALSTACSGGFFIIQGTTDVCCPEENSTAGVILNNLDVAFCCGKGSSLGCAGTTIQCTGGDYVLFPPASGVLAVNN